MSATQAATYARVSSDVQQEARTIENQLADLRACIARRGFQLAPELEFVDDGYSGATLVRPALERLRDVAAAGGIDQLYVHCPDRLARNYAHQVLRLAELLRAGVEVIFLNREVGQIPEDQLVLQVQGMIAEYERAKILERSRRGKRHAAEARAADACCAARPMATATSPNRMGPGKPASRWTWRKRGSCARSSPGWGGIAVPLGKCSGG